MTVERPPAVLVVLIGPQASGKSTVAVALSQELRAQGERVALVELDQIAAMALPTLPSWDIAAHIFALVAGEWARADLTCVIAEGISTRDEVLTLLDAVPANVQVVTVAMTTPFDTALGRAQADLTRGMSRDRSWLFDRYEEWSAEMARIGADLRLDLGSLSVGQGVSLIATAIRSAQEVSGSPPNRPGEARRR